jgi:diaminopimelate epimerase
MRFTKAHAYGNDFLYVEEHQLAGVAMPSLARDMCDRHRGIGADGLIVYSRTPGGAAMRLFNADGTRAEVSGNGVRGLAGLLLRGKDATALVGTDLAETDLDVTIETDAGPKRLTRTGVSGVRETFRAMMGLPQDVRRLSLDVGPESIQVVALNIGNPHCVVIGPLPAGEAFRRLGAALERHERFREGTNVEFAEVDARDLVRILIWERGVGPTQSSGTGSCAALVAAASYGGAGRDAEVVAPGGSQRVEWQEDSVYLTGWAEIICAGDWLRPLPRA